MELPEHDPIVAEYARLADVYDRRWSRYIAATVRETLKRTELQPGDRVLDVGCGTGALLAGLRERWPEARLTGIDPSAEMLRRAEEKLGLGVDFKQAAAEEMPFSDAVFDVAVSSSAFHYFRRPAAALAEIKRVLCSGGRLVITDWCDDFWTCRVCDLLLRLTNRAHLRTYGARECRTYLEEAGFADVAVARYKITWLWGLMTASALKVTDGQS